MAGRCGLIPEQVWDAEPIPSRGLYPGKPSGSAMPLVWAHAEFIKLLWAREHGEAFETLNSVRERYIGGAPAQLAKPKTRFWRTQAPAGELPEGLDLVIEDAQPFTLHLGYDGWQQAHDLTARAQPFGMWGVRIRAAELRRFRTFEFTRLIDGGWEAQTHTVYLLKR